MHTPEHYEAWNESAMRLNPKNVSADDMAKREKVRGESELGMRLINAKNESAMRPNATNVSADDIAKRDKVTAENDLAKRRIDEENELTKRRIAERLKR